MGDMGDDFRAMREHRREQKARRARNLELAAASGIAYTLRPEALLIREPGRVARDIVYGDPEPCCENPIRTLGWRTVRRARRARRRELRRLVREDRRRCLVCACHDEWATPAWLIARARRILGPFLVAFDPGLRCGVFVNPPYDNPATPTADTSVVTLDGVDWSPP